MHMNTVLAGVNQLSQKQPFPSSECREHIIHREHRGLGPIYVDNLLQAWLFKTSGCWSSSLPWRFKELLGRDIKGMERDLINCLLKLPTGLPSKSQSVRIGQWLSVGVHQGPETSGNLNLLWVENNRIWPWEVTCLLKWIIFIFKRQSIWLFNF